MGRRSMTALGITFRLRQLLHIARRRLGPEPEPVLVVGASSISAMILGGVADSPFGRWVCPTSQYSRIALRA